MIERMRVPREEATKAKRHRHDFHGLWDQFGPLGRQDVHCHPCVDDCARVLLGPGRGCDGDSESHWRETL